MERSKRIESILNGEDIEPKTRLEMALSKHVKNVGVKLKKVNSLSEVTESKYIYLIKSEDASSPNVFDEYILTDEGVELIGTTETQAMYQHMVTLISAPMDGLYFKRKACCMVVNSDPTPFTLTSFANRLIDNRYITSEKGYYPASGIISASAYNRYTISFGVACMNRSHASSGTYQLEYTELTPSDDYSEYKINSACAHGSIGDCSLTDDVLPI